MASPGGTTFTLPSVMDYVVEKQLSIEFSNYLYDIKYPSSCHAHCKSNEIVTEYTSKQNRQI